MAPSWVYSMILWILWARFLSSTNQCTLLPQNVQIWQNSSILHSCSPYSYGNDLSEVRSSSGSQYSWMHLTVSSPFSCSQNVIHYCIEILLLRTCTYVVRILLLVVLPPQMRVLGGVRTVSVRPPGVPYVSIGPLSKRPCRAPSTNAASIRGILVYAHTLSLTIPWEISWCKR